MASLRHRYTKEFKEAAARRLEQGASTAEVARVFEVSAKALRRWQQELRQYGATAFSGYGKRRALITPRTRAVVFHLTEEEYIRLKATSSGVGARSLSDFARSQILLGTPEPSLEHVDEKLDELRSAVQQLAHQCGRQQYRRS